MSCFEKLNEDEEKVILVFDYWLTRDVVDVSAQSYSAIKEKRKALRAVTMHPETLSWKCPVACEGKSEKKFNKSLEKYHLIMDTINKIRK